MISLTDDESSTLDAEGLPALRARLANGLTQLAGRAKAINAKAEAEGRDLTPQESAQFDKLTAQFNDADFKLRALADDLPLGNVSPRPRIVPPQPIRTNNGPHNFGVPMTTTYAPTGAKFENMFAKRQPPPSGQFISFGDFCKTALLDPLSPRLRSQISNESMSEGVGADGGFAVPVQFVSQLLDAALESEVIRPRSTVVPMSSSQAHIPAFDYVDNTGAKRAGLQLRWIAELETSTEQKAKVKALEMIARKAGIYVSVSSELLEDAALFSSRLEVAMANAIAAGLDNAFVRGTGAGQPLGLLNGAGTLVVAKEGSQVADTIVEANIVKMAARLHPSSWANAIWIVSPSTLAQLLTLSQTQGPSSGARSVLLRETDSGLTMLTRPVIVSDCASALGDVGDILFVDLRHYLIGMRKEATLETSIHSGWFQDAVGFRLLLRAQGLPEMSSVMTLRDGSTASYAVTLAERA